MPWFFEEADSLSRDRVEALCAKLVDEAKQRLSPNLKRVLLLPPDLTRAHSGAGWITETIYNLLPKDCDIHVIPTLGQHIPHTPEENRWMFGSIPEERIHAHDWREGVTYVGTVPGSLVAPSTGGVADWDIPLYLNSMLMDEQ